MAKSARVQLTDGEEWQDAEVPNFYNPEKHKTVRLPNTTEKIPYHKIRIDGGRIYNHTEKKWEFAAGEDKEILVGVQPLPLPFASNSLKELKLESVLERNDDMVEVIKEIYRVLAPSGVVKSFIAVGNESFSDPEARHYLNPTTLSAFSKRGRFNLFSNYNVSVRGSIMEVTLKK